MDNINWTKGIDQKTGKPLDYDPGKDLQTYSGIANHTPNEPVRKVCPTILGGNKLLAVELQPKNQTPLRTGADRLRRRQARHRNALQGQGLERRHAALAEIANPGNDDG
jgi:hypothetical protein